MMDACASYHGYNRAVGFYMIWSFDAGLTVAIDCRQDRQMFDVLCSCSRRTQCRLHLPFWRFGRYNWQPQNWPFNRAEVGLRKDCFSGAGSPVSTRLRGLTDPWTPKGSTIDSLQSVPNSTKQSVKISLTIYSVMHCIVITIYLVSEERLLCQTREWRKRVNKVEK